MKLQRPDPGIDAAKSGLHGKAGIFFNAGLLEKGEPRFDLQDLDPYLVFDSRESMLGTLENPTLDLDPATPSTLDVITATRAGVATYTDADGNIATASADTVRVDYTQGAELTPTVYQRVVYTDFSSGWSTSSMTSVTGGGFQGNPSVVLTSTSGNGYTRFQFTTVAGQSYTASFYIRRITGSGAIKFINWDSEPNQPPPDISSQVSSEWSRVTVTFLGRSGGGNVSFGFRCVTSGDSVEIAMPQVEEGTTASDFVANTTGSPKFLSSAVYSDRVPMVLIEPSATNLLPYSEDFSNSAWSKNNVTLSSGFSAPDGSMNASKLEANAADSSLQNTFTVTSGTAYSVSFYLKTISGSLETAIALGSPGFPQNEGDGGRYKNITVTDEWQRFTLTSTADASAATGISFGGFSSFSTGEEVYIWGAQLETGSVSTSYIPTSGGDAAARTRAADDLVISGSDFDFYNQSDGTFYVESNTKLSDGVPFVVEADNGTNNRISLYYESNEVRGFLKSGGVTDANPIFGNRPTAGNLSRTAFSYKTNDFEGSVDGGSVVVDTSATIPTTINRFHLGSRFGQSDTHKLNGHIKRLIYWPYHSDSL